MKVLLSFALCSTQSPGYLYFAESRDIFHFLSLFSEVFLTTPTAMGTLLTELGEVVTNELTWVGNVVTTITSNPFLLLTTGILVLGAAVGILGRLLSRG